MTTLAWQAGLFLTQEHFQEWDRVLMDRDQRMGPTYDWGIKKINLNESQLAHQVIGVEQCVGRLITGDWFNIPEDDIIENNHQSLSSLGLQQLRDTPEVIYLYLKKTRHYHIKQIHITDEYDPDHSTDIDIKQTIYQLELQTEFNQHPNRLPIAKLLRYAQHYQYCPHYIPPLITTDANPRWKPHIDIVLGTLQQLGEILKDSAKDSINNKSRGLLDYQRRLGLAQIDAMRYRLDHWQTGDDSPRSRIGLPAYLIQYLIGGLMTLDHILGEHQFNPPRYNHFGLQTHLNQIIETVQKLLKTLQHQQTQRIALTHCSPGLYQADCRSLPEGLGSYSHLYIPFNAFKKYPRVLHHLHQQLVKIDNLDQIKNKIRYGLAGLPYTISRHPSLPGSDDTPCLCLSLDSVARNRLNDSIAMFTGSDDQVTALWVYFV